MSKFSYEKAQAELQEILHQLEHNEIGIDQLKSKLDRAQSLIDKCQQKLAETETAVNQLLQSDEMDQDATS